MFYLLVVIMVADFFNIGDWQTTISVPSYRAGGGKQLRMAKGRAEDQTSCRGDPRCIRNTIFFNCVPNHEFLRIKLGHKRPCTVTETKYWGHSRSALLRMTMVVVDFLHSKVKWGGEHLTFIIELQTYDWHYGCDKYFIYRRWWS